VKTPFTHPYLLTGIALAIVGSCCFQSFRSRQTTQSEHAAAMIRIAELESEVRSAVATRQTQQKQLLELDASLGEAKSKLTVAEAHKVQLGRELAATQKQLLAQSGREEDLNRELTNLRGKLANSTPLAPQIADARIVEPFASLPVPAIPTPERDHIASVVSVGPASAFVVLNYGANQGALPEQHFTIRRGTLSVATVHISDVRPNHSIAQVRPGTLQAALHKGDSAVLTE